MMDNHDVARDLVLALIQAGEIKNITQACKAYREAEELLSAEDPKYPPCN